MTEEQWLSETNRSQWMTSTLSDLRLPRTKRGRRKFRLFACACCRSMSHLLPHPELVEAVDAAERSVWLADEPSRCRGTSATRSAVVIVEISDAFAGLGFERGEESLNVLGGVRALFGFGELFGKRFEELIELVERFGGDCEWANRRIQQVLSSGFKACVHDVPLQPSDAR
jgi:hypothetical protein